MTAADPRLERWPPIYDANELAIQIKTLVTEGRLFDSFYWDLPNDGSWCQGDVVQLTAPLPHLDADGNAVVLEGPGFGYWLLLSNTCDLNRSLVDVQWAQLIPLFEVSVVDTQLQILRGYGYTRRFYIPSWTPGSCKHFLADFTMPVTLERAALTKSAHLEAHLSLEAWVLLHSCLVRYLARDDGRFQAG